MMSNEDIVKAVQDGLDVTGNMEKLYQQNRGLIGKVVSSLSGFNDPEDLMQQGYLALHKAALNYDPEAGSSFGTFAALIVRHELHRYIDSKSSVVRLPEYKARQIREYRKAVSDFTLQYGSDPDDEAIRQLMGLSPTVYKRLKSDLIMADMQSIDADPADGLPLAETIPGDQDVELDVCDRILLQEIQRVLNLMISSLPDMEQVAISSYLNDRTLTDLAREHGISVQRMSALRSKAVKRLKTYREVNYLRNLCFELYKNDLYSAGVKGVGVGKFKRTRTSQTEFVAIRQVELENILQEKYNRILRVIAEDQIRFRQYIAAKQGDTRQDKPQTDNLPS